ncbi:7-carboxy-7-deazaguanine synthase QueE [Campylobacter sp. JMF_04 NA10]|uniref:7-carboxy-7-deazaguanine synthase QueE n=1 Tax=Campylobacter sp. JMF_04 NA10 TaxID=2983824 RepID=UPI0022E9DAFB|nr:7-carboxy-7-deazaguanine synthase QueE [Campylobacter sp. JMF_04 NA10]MDA3076139.1 7-carboxy-7-deazaguanine synthase QueE [Campylobacter sp. JMF_04 NA10]
MRLVESFLSIQGEGKYSGRLALFMRFAGCNLKCAGFGVSARSPKTGEILVGCDTIRAVQTGHFESEEVVSAKYLIEKINGEISNANSQKPIIIITGGEPLLHHKNEIFIEFIQNLQRLNYQVHFETNGTILIDFEKFAFYKDCVFAISPKLSNSGEPREKRLNFEALKAIKKNAKDSFYKFVISPEFDAKAEICEILAECENDVFCMPLGANKAELEQNAEFVAKFCIKNGYNYSDRAHIRIWNDKESV